MARLVALRMRRARSGRDVARLLTDLRYADATVVNDYVGNPRFVTATLPD